MKYDAFISYRHAELDMEIAKKVHSGLETYKIPGAVRHKTGKKKMGRVFRDQEELPIGSDLDDNISLALKESEYLIVICSPRTPESYWVCKEIESFIELHDRNHILAVLIEGEPDESVPPQLLKDDAGNPVEPLAADVRGETKKERNRKFKTEILRLAAPIIGCTYDDLKQRHRERIIKRTIAIVSTVAAVLASAGAAFGIYNANVAARMKALADEKAALADEKAALADEKTKLAEEISIQYEGKQENQSRFFAQEAMTLLQSGNREDAILVAMEGLPSEGNDRPYVADAEYALSRAVYAYDCAKEMTFDRILQHKLAIKDLRTTEDRKKVITVDNGNRVYVWNVEDWSLLVSIEPTLNEFNSFENVYSADADDTGIYTTTDHELIKYDYQGNEIYRQKYEDFVKGCDLCGSTGKLALILQGTFLVLDPSDGSVLETFESICGYSFMMDGGYSDEHGLYVISHFDMGMDAGHISVYDIKTGDMKDIRLSEGYYLNSCVTPNGNIAVISCNSFEPGDEITHVVAELFSRDGNRLWAKDVPAHITGSMTFKALVKSRKYTADDGEHPEVVLTLEDEAFTLNEEDGSMVSSLTLPGDATALSVTVDGPYGRVGYRQGNFDLIDFTEGRIYSQHTFVTGESIKTWVVLKEQLAYVSYQSGEVHVVSWHSAPDIEDYVTFEEPMIPEAVSSDGNVYAIRPDSDYEHYIFMNADGTETCRYDGDAFVKGLRLAGPKAYLWDSDKLTVVDITTGSRERIVPSDYGFSEYSVEYYVNRTGSGCVFYTSQDLMIFDPEKKEVINEYESGNAIGSLLLSDDGKRVYIANEDGSLYAVDTSDLKRHDFKDERVRAIAAGYYKAFMALSPDGKYLAVCCADGMMRLIDTDSFETVSSAALESYLHSYISFTDDGTHVVVQGDDYRIRVYDITSRAYVTTAESDGTISYIVCDDESNLMAVCTGQSLFLYETKGYARVAYAEDGLVFLKSNDSVLVSIDRQDIKRTYYKDYKKLMEEAKKQFPGASLSDEKKTRYNVD
ncbi:MAG: toll/interleukin-1 receptor domain-containing protein [Lachnospiraceae bacterium]|nr:toll/interleukin-1 receptor domain-containing protein [Lachnospiraceae bacterium]